MQPYMDQNALDVERDHKHFHEKCRLHLYQIIQVELKDGSVHQGILHSFDSDKMYILMHKHSHSHSHHHMHHHSTDESSESRLFPLFGPFGLFGFPFFGIRRFGPFFPFFI